MPFWLTLHRKLAGRVLPFHHAARFHGRQESVSYLMPLVSLRFHSSLHAFLEEMVFDHIPVLGDH
ncbi:hypothetical protein EYZ11_000942 [Aspergillus tanneri]|uniref:Uncharacterized protein n=1 Tax=Aspergillus tanneri TaxID=1220188 RepID=A0A4S3JVZ6_9EURO|nr:hypothetical protein EYZ11_000942 [Aspergillus tanneri]